MTTNEKNARIPDPIRAGLTSDDMKRPPTAYDRLRVWVAARDNLMDFSEYDADEIMEHIDRLLIEAGYSLELKGSSVTVHAYGFNRDPNLFWEAGADRVWIDTDGSSRVMLECLAREFEDGDELIYASEEDFSPYGAALQFVPPENRKLVELPPPEARD